MQVCIHFEGTLTLTFTPMFTLTFTLIFTLAPSHPPPLHKLTFTLSLRVDSYQHEIALRKRMIEEEINLPRVYGANRCVRALDMDVPSLDKRSTRNFTNQTQC